MAPFDSSWAGPPVAVQCGAVYSTGVPIKEADDDYARWLIKYDAGITEEDRQYALAIRQALRSPEGLASETYRRVNVGEALRCLASAGVSS